ncbi:MAG: DNA primase [Thermoanaerobaculia bacterium]|nr:DNA primase [Thermoanaerobaculia bacterium]
MSLGHVNITPQLVQAVRDAVDIVGVAEEHTRLERRGHRQIGLCPLHKEKTPSFSVEASQNLFYCFGCGAGGDAIKLHMMLSGDDFPAAIEALAGRYGVPLPRQEGRSKMGPDLGPALEAAAAWFSQQLAAHPPTLAYLAERGIPLELANRYGLGYAPEGWDGLRSGLSGRFPAAQLEAAGLLSPSKQPGGQGYDRFRNRLMFPIRQAAGRIVGFGGRTLGDDDAKYINTRETERFDKGTLLYGLDQAKRAIRDSGRAILVEGYFDVLGTVAAGIEGAVACMGTSLTAEQAKALARYGEEVVVAFDGDAAGEKAYTRSLPILLRTGLTVRRAEFTAGVDPDSLRLESGNEALVERIESAPDAIEDELERQIPADARQQPQLQASLAPRIGELLSALPDPILRYSYGRIAAQRLGIPFDLMTKHLGGSAKSRRYRSEARDSGEAARSESSREAATRTPGLDQEQAVLRLLLSFFDDHKSSDNKASTGIRPVLPELMSGDLSVDPEMFWDPDCRALFSLVETASTDPIEDRIAGLRRRVEESRGPVELLARLVIEALDVPPVPVSREKREEELTRALAQLRRRWLTQRQQDLAREIRQAQSDGDAGNLERLVAEKAILSRRLHVESAALGGGAR